MNHTDGGAAPGDDSWSKGTSVKAGVSCLFCVVLSSILRAIVSRQSDARTTALLPTNDVA